MFNIISTNWSWSKFCIPENVCFTSLRVYGVNGDHIIWVLLLYIFLYRLKKKKQFTQTKKKPFTPSFYAKLKNRWYFEIFVNYNIGGLRNCRNPALWKKIQNRPMFEQTKLSFWKAPENANHVTRYMFFPRYFVYILFWLCELSMCGLYLNATARVVLSFFLTCSMFPWKSTSLTIFNFYSFGKHFVWKQLKFQKLQNHFFPKN